MYSSSSTSFDPFQYSAISTPNPNSIPFLHFPSPDFLHDNGDLLLCESLIPQHQILAPQGNQQMNFASISKKPTRSKKKTNPIESKQQPTSRKRTGKKDRHSKIYTAHGPRDRRMRLSLQIARKFFDLQDMLGFDKASKTIDWLFSKSKSAIKELTDNFTKLKRAENNGGRSVSCSSESEVMSGVKLTAEGGRTAAEEDSYRQQKRSKKPENKPVSSSAKESRDKARARARARTKEKQKIKGKTANPSNLGVENGKSFGLDKKEEEEEEEDNAGVGSSMDKYLGITSATKSTSIFDISHINRANFEDEFSVFQGNCERVLNNNNNGSRFSAIPDSKAGNVEVENPNSIFMSSPTCYSFENKTSVPNFIYQDQNLTSLVMASLQPHEQNPSLLFMNFSSSNHQFPTPLLPMSTALLSHFTEGNFSSTANPPIKYCESLY